jgi:hypothetical protein
MKANQCDNTKTTESIHIADVLATSNQELQELFNDLVQWVENTIPQIEAAKDRSDGLQKRRGKSLVKIE